MTFVEAAVEVLRSARKALPVDQLTRMAVERKLLSVVGRDPEQTMSERLTDAISRDVHHKTGIVQLRPGVFGLTVYPDAIASAPMPAVSSANVVSFAVAAQAVSAGAPAAEKTSVADPAAASSVNANESETAAPVKAARSRGRRGGRGKDAEAKTAELPVEAKTAPPVGVVETSPPAKPAKPSRRRRGAKGAKDDAALTEPVAALQSIAAIEPVVAAEPPALPEPPAMDDDFDMQSDEFDDLDATPSPAMMVSPGLEDIVRSGEEREKRDELRTASHMRDRERRRGRGGHKKERPGHEQRDARPEKPPAPSAVAPQAGSPAPGGRGRRGGRNRDKDPRGERPAQQAQPQHRDQAQSQHRDQAQHREQAQPQHRGQAQPHRDQARVESQQSPGAPKDLWAACLDVLMQSGRLHVQKLADELLRRRLVDGKGGHGELTARLRTVLGKKRPSTATLGNARSIVALGGGYFCIAGAKLEPEIAQAEEQLKQRLTTLQDLTARALQTRVERLKPPLFESVVRLTTEALGLRGWELVRRTPDVTYFGGDRPLYGVNVRILVAVWPANVPLSRRAVGELRAGLSAKGYQQGWLFSPASLSAEAIEEWKVAPTVEPFVGERFVQLCITHKIGVRNVPVSVETIDPGFWAELND